MARLNRGFVISLSTAAAYLAFICLPPLGHAQAQSAQLDASNSAAVEEASQMVPAYADLTKALDAQKVHPGYQFEARLQNKVHFKDGTELPAGTILLGRVTADQMQPAGTLRLALRFTAAEVKHGQPVPIKAMVLNITGSVMGSGVNLDNETPMWNGHTLRVDQQDVMSGVDMHSNMASANSAELVSTKKDNVKLGAGSQMSLVLAPRSQNRNSGM